jgi:hypothetical protein
MFNKLRTHFGVPGAIAVAAFVFAMAGGAWAANKYVITSTAQIKPSVLKKLTGAPGPPGAPGSNGSNGSNGAAGQAGGKGADGTSVTTSSFAGEKGACKSGGVEVKSASPTVNVCNGQTGFTETLPSGSTETGAWGYGPLASGVTSTRVSISFPIPVLRQENPLTGEFETDLVFIAKGVPPTPEEEAACPGTSQDPEAAPGNLCLYESAGFGNAFASEQNPQGATGEGAGEVGALVRFENSSAGGFAIGDWAVTAP